MKTSLAVILVLLLGGCASNQGKTQVMWHDGKCLFFVDGITGQQAGEISKVWDFEPCEIKVDSELRGGQGSPEDSDEVETP